MKLFIFAYDILKMYNGKFILISGKNISKLIFDVSTESN